MKTLDEVIKNFEICRKARLNLIRCDGCTYAIGDNDFCIDCNETDVLEWLKGYRAHIELDKIRDKCEAENEPLTWDELRTMEGKPVWVEADEKERWRIIREVSSEHLILESGLPLHKCWMNHPDGWQAYRKERS